MYNRHSLRAGGGPSGPSPAPGDAATWNAVNMAPVIVPYGDGCMLWRSEAVVGAVKRVQPDIENGYATTVVVYGERTNQPAEGA